MGANGEDREGLFEMSGFAKKHILRVKTAKKNCVRSIGNVIFKQHIQIFFFFFFWIRKEAS